jgi:4-amino-4-deoxy-L-arabinose transferase-like glycosyltransferase
MRRFTRADLLWLAGIAVVAFAARLAWVLYAEADPMDGRFADTVFYHVIAFHMTEGGGYTNPYTFLPTALFPPGYIFFLVPLYWVFGPEYEIAELANVVLATLSAGLLYLLAWRLAGSGTARVTAAAFAVFPGQVFFTSLIYSEVLFTFVMLGGLLLLVAARQRDAGWRWYLAFGVIAGAAALVRSVGLSMVLIGPLYLLLSTRDWRSTAQRTALIGIGATLLIVPWAVRNAITLGDPIFTSSAAGINLWQGHHEGASGGGDAPDALLNTYGPLHRPGGEGDVSTAGVKEAVYFAVHNPLDEIGLAGDKLRELYAGDTDWIDLNEQFGQKAFMSSALRDVLRMTGEVFYFAVIALAGLGVLRWLVQRDGAALLPVVTILVWSFAHIVTFGDLRYHVPVMPMFALLAGYGLAWLRLPAISPLALVRVPRRLVGGPAATARS